MGNIPYTHWYFLTAWHFNKKAVLIKLLIKLFVPHFDNEIVIFNSVMSSVLKKICLFKSNCFPNLESYLDMLMYSNRKESSAWFTQAWLLPALKGKAIGCNSMNCGELRLWTLVHVSVLYMGLIVFMCATIHFYYFALNSKL